METSATQVKLRANGSDNSQHCWRNNVVSCCIRLHVAKILTGFKFCATTHNNTQQHATGCANRPNMKHPTMLRPFTRNLKGPVQSKF